MNLYIKYKCSIFYINISNIVQLRKYFILRNYCTGFLCSTPFPPCSLGKKSFRQPNRAESSNPPLRGVALNCLHCSACESRDHYARVDTKSQKALYSQFTFHRIAVWEQLSGKKLSSLKHLYHSYALYWHTYVSVAEAADKDSITNFQ